MKQVAAIALLALRHVVRSRVVLVLSVLLFAAAFLLPLALRSDGTPAGLIRIHLAYVLGLGSFLLTLATLWAGHPDLHVVPARPDWSEKLAAVEKLIFA